MTFVSQPSYYVPWPMPQPSMPPAPYPPVYPTYHPVPSVYVPLPPPGPTTAPQLFKRLSTLVDRYVKDQRREAPKPAPAKPAAPKSAEPASDPALERLKSLSPQQLAHLGATDKKAFFDALRPAAEEGERKYGVPAKITLAQAALESGWGKHAIGGFNIFGIKGKGPAGSVVKRTWEVIRGRTIHVDAAFAKYRNFYQAVVEHGKRFHNGYYDKALNQFKQDKSVANFARNITGVYATDPAYASKLMNIIQTYNL